jgi:hypothetical protein
MRVPTIGIIVSLLLCQAGVARDPESHGPSTASAADHTFERAGWPNLLSPHATPSVTPHDGLGYIGGSKLKGGDGRGPMDGTFGFDYQGWKRRPGRIFLGWAHDRQRQPQLGPYRTDTHQVPDPFHGLRPASTEHNEAR